MPSSKIISHNILDSQVFLTLREAQTTDFPAIRVLVNAAYKELADMGLNYTASYQDEETTLRRLSKGRAFVLATNEQKILATILYFKENYFTKKNTAYVGQFGVEPSLKKSGLGTILMNHCEQLAREENYEGIQLDTAKPANHLVNWYIKRGYQIVGETHWEGKTYDSYIFEKLFTV